MMFDDRELVIFWDYVSSSGGPGAISSWYDTLQKADKAKFDVALDRVRIHGSLVAERNGLITPVARSQWTKKNRDGFVKLRELRVTTPSRALRPLLCHGPIAHGREITFLVPAWEKGDKLEPANAVAVAIERYKEILDDPSEHRRRFRP